MFFKTAQSDCTYLLCERRGALFLEDRLIRTLTRGQCQTLLTIASPCYPTGCHFLPLPALLLHFFFSGRPLQCSIVTGSRLSKIITRWGQTWLHRVVPAQFQADLQVCTSSRGHPKVGWHPKLLPGRGFHFGASPPPLPCMAAQHSSNLALTDWEASLGAVMGGGSHWKLEPLSIVST